MIIFELMLCAGVLVALLFVKLELTKINKMSNESKDRFNAMIRQDKDVQRHIKDYL